jgi:hypothetical protein
MLGDAVPATRRSRWTRLGGQSDVVPGMRRVAWLVFAVVAVASIARGTGPIIYDADAYWSVTMSLLSNGAHASEFVGYYGLRGVLTVITFVPAALVTKVVGVTFAEAAILMQNALLLGWIAGFLVPRVIVPWRRLGLEARWVVGLLCWLLLGGFAPYALVDLYAAAAVTAAIVCLRSPRPGMLLGAGLLIAYTVNVRPAYVPVVVLVGVLVLVVQRWRAIVVAVGVVVGLAPQMLYNARHYGTFSPYPSESSWLVALQTGYASYVVRYDTIPSHGGVNPQQFHCSPDMANGITTLPTSATELFTTFVAHFPESAIFTLTKVGAALHWPLSTPYGALTPGLDGLYAVATTLVVVAGAVFLLACRSRGEGPFPWAHRYFAAAVVVASVATLAGSATETRFATPLVLWGIAGVAGIVESRPVSLRRHWVIISVTLAVTAFVVFLGVLGLAHPAPPGGVDVGVCAEVSHPAES